MNPQLQGIEDIEGTYVFDVRQSVKALRLNRFSGAIANPCSANW